MKAILIRVDTRPTSEWMPFFIGDVHCKIIVMQDYVGKATS